MNVPAVVVSAPDVAGESVGTFKPHDLFPLPLRGIAPQIEPLLRVPLKDRLSLLQPRQFRADGDDRKHHEVLGNGNRRASRPRRSEFRGQQPAEHRHSRHQGPAEGMPIGGWVTTREFAENNPDLIAGFRRALGQSAEDLQGNRDLHLDLVPQYAAIDNQLAEELTLPHYDTELQIDLLQSGADLMHRYEIISDELDVAELAVE